MRRSEKKMSYVLSTVIAVIIVMAMIVPAIGNPVGEPDLKVSLKYEVWYNEAIGWYKLTYEIENIGDAPADASRAAIYIDDAYKTSRYTPSLASGASHTTVALFKISGESDKIKVCADKDNVVVESNENNNCRENMFPGVYPKPDLIITDKEETFNEDGTFNVTYTVNNVGECRAGGSVACVYSDGGHVPYMDMTVEPLNPGAYSSPKTVGPFVCPAYGETKNITVCADNYDAVDESNEDNNCTTNIVECPYPDLVIEMSESVEFGECNNTFNVTYTVHNKGGAHAGESTACFYVNGTRAHNAAIGELNPGDSSDPIIVGSFICSCGMTRNITVCADCDEDVDESDETNNCEVNIVECRCPDLVITEKSVEFIDCHNTFNVTYTVHNQGEACACKSNTTIYINGTNVLEDPVPRLAPCQIHAKTVGPFDCPSGTTLNVTVCADNGDKVKESDENNNCEVKIVPCPCPDLVITEKSETIEDGNFTVTYTVHNQGECYADESVACVYVNGGLIDRMNVTIPRLNVSETNTTTVGLFGCPPCGETKNVTVCADCGREVNESDETNNCRVNYVECPCPDLVITEKFETLLDDCNFTVTYTVHNRGEVAAGGSSTTITINGIHAPLDPVPLLNPSESYTNTVGPFDCTSYDFTCCETVTIEVHADDDNEVAESNEDNNSEENEYHCACPDLIITDKYETLFDSCNFSVTYTVKNIGECTAGASNTTIYIPGVTSTEDPVPALAAGAIYESTVSDPEKFVCPYGQTLPIKVCADNDDEVTESNEDNNCLENVLPCPEYPYPKPDLKIIEKFETMEDGTFTVTYTVENQGEVAAGESDTTIFIDGVSVMEDPAPPLDPTTSYSNTVGPFECPCGATLNVTVCADNDNVVVESNETNNCEVNEVVCPVGKPDLVLEEKTETWEDGTLTVTYTVSNCGPCACASAPESITGIYVDGELKGTDSVPELAKCTNYTSAVVIPNVDCPCGETIEVKVFADHENLIDECSEDNNQKVNVFECPVGKPDLVLEEKTETWEDGTLTVTYTVSNCGPCACASAPESITGIYVDGELKGTDSVPELAKCTNYTSAVVIPNVDCPCGETIEVKVFADHENLIDECSEDNNQKVNVFECPGIPDLVITEKSITRLDGAFNVNYKVNNIGCGDAGESHTTVLIDGVEVLEVPTPAIAKGECHEATVGPFDCPSLKKLRVQVCADNKDEIAESNEDNNCSEVNIVGCPYRRGK